MRPPAFHDTDNESDDSRTMDDDEHRDYLD